MTHSNKVLDKLIKTIIELYFNAVFLNHDIREIEITPSDYSIYDWNVAGAYIDLKRKDMLKVPDINTDRLWSSIWLDINDKNVSVGVTVYIKEGYVATIEIFAARHDFPDIVTSYELSA